MSENAISVENLGKSYLVGHNQPQRGQYQTFRDVLAREARGLARKTRDMVAGRAIIQGDAIEEFWALKDVSFEVRPGDRVGIVGRNGSGKSTLLKVLSRITEPTRGRVGLKGRVSSLLEVGTGFHPELTGRENVFLTGAILGMGRQEIYRKFDEIVDFAGVEAFLDTPVKRYSSGMYVRLAFAVAAHLEPEILIVDEVLAVGDAEFQKKCLGKMAEVGGEGRTILFVSHNMSAVRTLCNRALYLQKGMLAEDSSDVSSVIGTYLKEGIVEAGAVWERPAHHSIDNDYIRPTRMMLQDCECNPVEGPISSEAQLQVRLEFDVDTHHSDLLVGYAIHDEMGNLLYWTYTKDSLSQPVQVRPGANVVVSELPVNMLNDGEYKLTFISAIPHVKSIFSVEESDIYIRFEISQSADRPAYWIGKRNSILAPIVRWRVEER